MNATEYTPNQIPIPADDILQKVVDARAQGALIHDFQDPEEYPGVIPWLASHDIRTTTEPRPAGSIWEHWGKDQRQQRATARQIGNLMLNAEAHLEAADHPVINEAMKEGRLGTLLMGLLLKTDLLRVDGLHVADLKRDKQGRAVDGTVTAESVTFGVETTQEQALLSTFFQAWCQKGAITPKPRTKKAKRPKKQEEPDKLHIITPGIDEETGKPTVAVSNMNEFTIRVVEDIMVRTVAAEEEARWGSRLPEQRLPASLWKEGCEINGQPFYPETIHPKVEERIDAVNTHYNQWRQRMPVVTYRADLHSILTPNSPESVLDGRPEVLGTSVSGAFEQVRKVVNSVSGPLRGSNQFNQPQHPNKKKRLLVEENVDIRRDPTGTGQPGPAVPRALKARERAGQKTRDILAEQKSRPIEAGGKGIATVLGIGAEVTLEAGGKLLPMVKDRGVRVRDELKARRQQNQAALESGKKIDALIAETRQLPPAA